MSADEEGEIKPEREKTDGGRTLIHEGRQGEDTLKQIKRVALVPPQQTIDRNSIMDSIMETLQFFIRDAMGAAHAAIYTLLETQGFSMDNKMIINGPDGTIHRAVEVSHTDEQIMQMFDAMVAGRDEQGGVNVLGVGLYFVLPMRATEMAAETKGVQPHAQHTFIPSYLIEASGMGTGLSDRNLDQIGDTVRAAFGGLKVATMMRCRIRDISGAASEIVAGQHGVDRTHMQPRQQQDRPGSTSVELPTQPAQPHTPTREKWNKRAIAVRPPLTGIAAAERRM